MSEKDTAPGTPDFKLVFNTDLLQVQQHIYARRVSQIRTLSLGLIGLSLISLVVSTIQTAVSTTGPSAWYYYVVEAVAFVLFSASWWLVRRKAIYITPVQLNLAAGLIVVSVLICAALVQLFETMVGGLIASYTVIPVCSVFVGLGRKSTLALSVLGLAATIISYVLKSQGANSYDNSELINWSMAYLVTTGGVILFSRRLDYSIALADSQSLQLRQLLQALNTSTGAGASLSHQLTTVTQELNATSRLQAGSTQEQVAAVTEVTASLEELGETATQIAQSANQAAQSAIRTVDTATIVKASRVEALSVADQGNAAVLQTVESVSQVRIRIEQLGQRLLNLTGQTRRVGNIIDLIDEIADETHLLALNASIEAAGGIMSETGSDMAGRALRGERFGVIAQEIKNLADRSRESTEEVRLAIQEMQGAVAGAVLVAEEGKKATSEASLRSQIAGAVINRLNSLIDSSSNRFEDILGAAEEVQQRCEEISIATSQQRTANQQILVTMRGVAEIARENAGVVNQLSDSAIRATQQVEQLNVVLANASLTANMAISEDAKASNSESQLQLQYS